MPPHRLTILPLLAVTAALGAACGSSSDSGSTAISAPPETGPPSGSIAAAPPPSPPAGGSIATAPPPTGSGASPAPTTAPAGPGLPDTEVVDLATGTKLSLASFTPAAKPLLVWFWAPW